MKAPDKIYMPNELLSEEWCRHIEGQDTEYISKNALIEILQGYSHPLTKLVMQDIIDKINSL